MFNPWFDYRSLLPRFLLPDSGQPASVEGFVIETFPRWYSVTQITWTIPAEWEEENPRFQVFRSRTEGSNYVLLTPQPVADRYFLDESPKVEQSKISHYFYYVEALLDDGRVFHSTEFSTQPRMRAWQRIRKEEINRREYILLSRFTGVPSILLRRKRSGMRCRNCWSNAGNAIVKPHCQVCFGTAFEGGYLSVAQILFQYDSTIETAQYTHLGRFEDNQIGGWTVAFPDMESMDLLIRLTDNSIYRVEATQNTQLLGENVRQLCRLTELAKTDTEYQLLNRELGHVE
jgi:hypothetical protein